jgi:TonB family protein
VQKPAPRAEARQATVVEAPSKLRALPLVIGAFIVFVGTWGGLRTLRTNQAPAPTVAVAETTREALPAPASAPEIRDEPEPVSAAPVETPAESESVASLAAIHEVLPNVPRRASQTITGTLRVSVRLIVDPDGTVFAALIDDPGPSRYFERLAVDAAKQWTFPATETVAQRLVLVRFAFSRNGTTARAVPLR